MANARIRNPQVDQIVDNVIAVNFERRQVAQAVPAPREPLHPLEAYIAEHRSTWED